MDGWFPSLVSGRMPPFLHVCLVCAVLPEVSVVLVFTVPSCLEVDVFAFNASNDHGSRRDPK